MQLTVAIQGNSLRMCEPNYSMFLKFWRISNQLFLILEPVVRLVHGVPVKRHDLPKGQGMRQDTRGNSSTSSPTLLLLSFSVHNVHQTSALSAAPRKQTAKVVVRIDAFMLESKPSSLALTTTSLFRHSLVQGPGHVETLGQILRNA
jgi:hypothetical protein